MRLREDAKWYRKLYGNLIFCVPHYAPVFLRVKCRLEELRLRLIRSAEIIRNTGYHL